MALDDGGVSLIETMAAMSPDERARAERFRFEHLRRRYALGRAALRRILARYRDDDPAAIQFAYGPHGKPRVADEGGPHFNVSHSDDLAVIAVSSNGPVGVDVERVHDLRDLTGLAARYFARTEYEAIAGLPRDARAEAFFHYWTGKEAYVKATGDGLSIPLDGFTVCREGGPVVIHDQSAGSSGGWWTHALVPGTDYVAAVATLVADASVILMEANA